MKNTINFTIATTLASIGITAVGVLLIESLLLAAVWAMVVLVVHSIAIALYGYYELLAEFGPNSEWAKRFEERMGVK